MKSSISNDCPPWIIAATLFVVVLICHGFMVQGQFMVDDFQYLQHQQQPAKYQKLSDFLLKSDGHHFTPLGIFFNIVFFKLFTKSAYFYGLNILLFYANSVGLYFLVRAISGNGGVGALAAILFAVHPFNAEIINHCTLSSILLATILSQMSMYCFWRAIPAIPSRWMWMSLSLFAFICAALFIETALLIPVYLLIFCLRTSSVDCKNIARLIIPFGVIAAGYFMIWLWRASGDLHIEGKIEHLQISALSYVATLGILLKWYFRNLFDPDDIVFIRNFPPLLDGLGVGSATVILIIIFAGILLWVWRKSDKGLALAWFLIGFIFLIPASVVHAYSMGMVIEPYWFYFSLMGFFMLLALLFWDLRAKIGRVVWRGLIIAIVLFWGIVSFRQHVIARTEVSYLQYWLEKSPGNLLPQFMLGTLYGYEGRFFIPEALMPAMNEQADIFIRNEQYYPAARLLERIISSQPSAPQTLNRERQLVKIYFHTHEMGLANALIDKLLKIFPDDKELLDLKIRVQSPQ